MRIFPILALLLIAMMPLPLQALEVPQLSGRINDRAGLLSPGTAADLERRLAAFEREQSTQVAVLTIPSLEGEDIDQYAIRVAEQWKIGQQGKDNGVLLLLARQERKVRIEVGMGLQGVLPDVSASHIIRDVMRPHLKSGDFDRGISAGVESIMAATKGEYKASPSDRKSAPAKKGPSLLMLLAVLVVAVLIMGRFSRWLGGVAGAAGLPLVSWFSFPALSLLVLAGLAAAGLAAGLLLGAIAQGLFGGGHGGYYGGGGWGGGGFYGGGDLGGTSSDSDSFSGGGGDFDGGGSSDEF